MQHPHVLFRSKKSMTFPNFTLSFLKVIVDWTNFNFEVNIIVWIILKAFIDQYFSFSLLFFEESTIIVIGIFSGVAGSVVFEQHECMSRIRHCGGYPSES